MNNRSKVAILSSLSNLIWFILVCLWHRLRVAELTGEALAQAWGGYFIALIAGFIVLNILGTIIVMTMEKMSGGQGFEEKTDERDRHIEGLAMRVYGLLFSLGFLASCCLLALGLGLSVFFTALAGTVMLSSLALWITHVVGYERGI